MSKQSIVAHWRGGRRYEIGRPGGGPTIMLDGATEAGPSPVDGLLASVAACSAIDVEAYLAKRRTPPERLAITVEAERREQVPRRVVRLRLEFAVDGARIEAAHARRAVALSLQKYCSVTATLAPDVAIEAFVVVNGASAEPAGE